MPARPNRYRNLTWGLLAVLLMPPFVRSLFPGAGVLGPLIFVLVVSKSLIGVRDSRLLRVVLATAMAAVAVRAVSASAQFLRGPVQLEVALPQTRVLAVAEALSGQLYLAILVARLVGLQMSPTSSSSGPPTGQSSARARTDRPTNLEAP